MDIIDDDDVDDDIFLRDNINKIIDSDASLDKGLLKKAF